MSEMDVRLLDWDDEIEKESEFTVLEPGDYDFEIAGFERSQYDGSDKIPACKMALVEFRVSDGKGNKTTITDRYYLVSSMEWKLSQLFKAVGMKEEGKKARMDWSALPGKKGRCKVSKEKNQKNDNYHNNITSLYAKAKGTSWD